MNGECEREGATCRSDQDPFSRNHVKNSYRDTTSGQQMISGDAATPENQAKSFQDCWFTIKKAVEQCSLHCGFKTPVMCDDQVVFAVSQSRLNVDVARKKRP